MIQIIAAAGKPHMVATRKSINGVAVMNAVISLFRLGVIALIGVILVSYARRKREDKLAREANEAKEAKELEQWWGAVGHHVTEKEAEDAALQLRDRAP